MGLCKKDVTPLLTHWSYIFLALSHGCHLLKQPQGHSTGEAKNVFSVNLSYAKVFQAC